MINMAEASIKGRILLADNKNISDKAFLKARNIRKQIVALVENRQEYIIENHLDPKFGLPDANWNDADFFSAYHHIRYGNYDVLNRLRFFAQAFTGYQLFSLQPAKGLPSVNRIPKNYDEHICKLRPEPDFWVYYWIDCIATIPASLIVSFPKMLGEIGWDVAGQVVNHDTYVYQERINVLYESGVLGWLSNLKEKQDSFRILEIGGGYGALAYTFHKIFPGSTYVNVDIPESLLFSGSYLSLVNPGHKISVYESCPTEKRENKVFPESGDFILIPNYMFEQIIDQFEHFDLVINTLSMSEMSEYQVRVYARGISKLIGNHGIFFEQNQNNKPVGFINCKDYLSKYFKKNLRLDPKLYYQTQGIVDLWANFDLASVLDKYKPVV